MGLGGGGWGKCESDRCFSKCAVQDFAGGLSDRFSRLEHPSVFIHGLYGSFHKTFTP